MSTTLTTTVCPMAVAIELSGSKWIVASWIGGACRIRRKSLSQEAVTDRFAALVGEVVAARKHFGLDDAAPVLVAYEAGQEGFWLVRALRTIGLAAEVIDPVSLQVDRRARRAKTDRLDAEALVTALWRCARGEVRALRFVRTPSESDEDNREWQRECDRLKAERRACADRISKKLRTHGIWHLSPRWRVQLREGRLHTFAGPPLSKMLNAALVVELDRLELVEEKLAQWLRHSTQLDPTATQRMTRLAQLRGIGKVGAGALSLLLFWRQFDNRRQVGACIGLVGTPYDSGTQRQDQGISKAGDPRLRALLIELAWLWLRYQPESAISQWFRSRTQGNGSRGKRVMIVAVARRLAIALWRYLRDGVLPQGARTKLAIPA